MKTIANGITNLTDARYFSAMGVDWIGYDMRPNSGVTIEHLIAFSEWVEGPDFLVDVRGRTESEIGEILSDFNAAALILEEGTSLGNYSGEIVRAVSDKGQADITIVGSGDLLEIAGSGAQDIWVVAKSVNDIRAAVNAGVAGVVLTGGDEEEVGVKNYDDLDELFDALND